MRASELGDTIRRIGDVIGAAGRSAAQQDFERVADLLAEYGETDVETALVEMRRAFASDAARDRETAVGSHSETLLAAGLDEARFKTALAKIEADKTLSKDDVIAIARTYGVIRMNGRSRASAIESIEKHFYWRAIDQDSRAVASKATPW